MSRNGEAKTGTGRSNRLKTIFCTVCWTTRPRPSLPDRIHHRCLWNQLHQRQPWRWICYPSWSSCWTPTEWWTAVWLSWSGGTGRGPVYVWPWRLLPPAKRALQTPPVRQRRAKTVSIPASIATRNGHLSADPSCPSRRQQQKLIQQQQQRPAMQPSRHPLPHPLRLWHRPACPAAAQVLLLSGPAASGGDLRHRRSIKKFPALASRWPYPQAKWLFWPRNSTRSSTKADAAETPAPPPPPQLAIRIYQPPPLSLREHRQRKRSHPLGLGVWCRPQKAPANPSNVTHQLVASDRASTPSRK